MIWAAAVVVASDAFVIPPPSSPFLTTSQHHNTPLHAEQTPKSVQRNKEGEDILRGEIARKNTELENEEEYAVAEGADMVVDVMEEQAGATTTVATSTEEKSTTTTTQQKYSSSSSSSSSSNTTALQKRLTRITTPRPYALFLAEKAANIVDDVWESVTRGIASDVQVGTSNTSDNDIDDSNPVDKREQIVILGTGWGAAALLKGMDASKFDVTVISPRNFFLFTPMLAGASVGTVEYRSITEPVREINLKVNYLEATATYIDPDTNTVECESVMCDGNSCTIEDFSIQYDRLVVAVGAQTNTFGIPGVREHCCFLKQVEDARRIRTAIVNCFERANLPYLTDEQRVNILTFAVIGAGPTGIEFASELRDFVEQDGPKYYPKLLKHVRIKVIEASSSVLAPFDKSLQDAAVEQLTLPVRIKDPDVLALLPERFKLTELLLDSGVSEVTEDRICLNNGEEIPYGLSVWAAGNGPLPITLQLIDALTDAQSEEQSTARGRLVIDPWLRVLGGNGKILAFGDCAFNTKSPLPATAQVASQQGEYLARLFSNCDNLDAEFDESDEAATTTTTKTMLPPIRHKSSIAEFISGLAMVAFDVAAPFQFLNLGILAYTGGGSALAQLQVAPGEKGSVKGKGKIGFGLWRSVYLSKQVSWRNRFLVSTDWVKTQIFGRDITRA